METETFSIEAMVRGYHVYQDIWDAALGVQLSCQREPRNRQVSWPRLLTRWRSKALPSTADPEDPAA